MKLNLNSLAIELEEICKLGTSLIVKNDSSVGIYNLNVCFDPKDKRLSLIEIAIISLQLCESDRDAVIFLIRKVLPKVAFETSDKQELIKNTTTFIMQ